MWPSGLMASSSLLLLSLAAFLLECHRLGIFTARIFPSQSNRLQLEPGTAPGWAEAPGEGHGGCQGRPGSSALKASAQSPPSLEMQTSASPLGRVRGNLGFWSCGAPGEVMGGLGDQRLHLSEERSWPWPHFLQPRLSHEGSGLGFHPQVGPRLSGPWRHPALVGGGAAECVTCICPPLGGPGSLS